MIEMIAHDLRFVTRSLRRTLRRQPEWSHLAGADEPAYVSAAYVSEDFFPTLQVDGALGRTFEARENVPALDRVVVVSAATWRSRFGVDPSIVGGTVRLGDQPHTIVASCRERSSSPPRARRSW